MEKCGIPLTVAKLFNTLDAPSSPVYAVYYYARGDVEKVRAETWKALEFCKGEGKCRFIGVSNYPTRLMKAAEEYATIYPCVNQLESAFVSFHGRALALEFYNNIVSGGGGTF